MYDLPRVHLPAANLPKSPNLSTSPLSAASVVPLYDASWPALPRPEQRPASARQLFQQPDGLCCPKLIIPAQISHSPLFTHNLATRHTEDTLIWKCGFMSVQQLVLQ